MKHASIIFALALSVITFASAGAASLALSETTATAIAAMTPLSKHPPPSITGKPVVISFFASWCPPCTDEFQQLNQLRARFREADLAIISLNMFEGHFEKNRKHRMKRFLNRTAPTFPVLGGLSDDALSGLFGGIDRIPTVLIFDKAGQAVYSFIHKVDAVKRHATFRELEEIITPLVTAP